MTTGAERFHRFVRRNISLLSSVAFVSLVIVGACVAGDSTLAICLLSFWHYYFYWLAYFFGAVPLGVFKRDAIAMKTVSLTALAFVYLASPPDLVSLAVVAAGLLLNIAAAKALGSDRTYYGQEVSDLPRRQITAFPYSWISHPMLLGNIAAFGGTMINAGFRQQWWPLACAHMAFNLGLLVMEITVTPRRHGALHALAREAGTKAWCCSMQTGVCIAAALALFAWDLGSRGAWSSHPALGAAMAAGTFIYALVIFCSYSSPTMQPREQRDTETQGPP